MFLLKSTNIKYGKNNGSIPIKINAPFGPRLFLLAERKGFDLPPGRPGRGSDMPPACHSLPLPFESHYWSIPIKINAPFGTFVFIGGEKGIRTLAWG
jgi:hypothetical protein